MVTEVSVGIPPQPSGGAYVKFEKRAGDFAVASIGVQVELDGRERCRSVAVTLGALAPTPLRAPAAESLLQGQRVPDSASDSVSDGASEELLGEAERLVPRVGPALCRHPRLGRVQAPSRRRALPARVGRGHGPGSRPSGGDRAVSKGDPGALERPIHCQRGATRRLRLPDRSGDSQPEHARREEGRHRGRDHFTVTACVGVSHIKGDVVMKLAIKDRQPPVSTTVVERAPASGAPWTW